MCLKARVGRLVKQKLSSPFSTCHARIFRLGGGAPLARIIHEGGGVLLAHILHEGGGAPFARRPSPLLRCLRLFRPRRGGTGCFVTAPISAIMPSARLEPMDPQCGI